MLFRITWIDDDGNKVGEDGFDKQNVGAAIRAACSRLKMSPHLCPTETYGFYVSWYSIADKSKNI